MALVRFLDENVPQKDNDDWDAFQMQFEESANDFNGKISLHQVKLKVLSFLQRISTTPLFLESFQHETAISSRFKNLNNIKPRNTTCDFVTILSRLISCFVSDCRSEALFFFLSFYKRSIISHAFFFLNVPLLEINLRITLNMFKHVLMNF